MHSGSHPGFFGWWKHRHGGHGPHDARGHAHPFAGCQPHGEHGRPGSSDHDHASAGPPRGPGGPGFNRFGGGGPDRDDFGAGLGVRRPLRFLAHKLELEEPQVERLAITLDRLKTERAQAEVDQRRRTGSIADAFASPTLDVASLASASAEQLKSAERLESAVQRALTEIHAMLDDDQRRKLAYLLRTGMLTI